MTLLLPAFRQSAAGDTIPISMSQASTNSESPSLPSGVVLACVTDAAIDFNTLVESVKTPHAGAVVLFLGTVRKTTHGRETDSLTYEAYASMAEAEMQRVLEQIATEWPICRIGAIHRTGPLELGDTAVAIAASGPHRDETFAAGRAAIDRIKESVPIWKQEHWADGEIEWVDSTATSGGGA